MKEAVTKVIDSLTQEDFHGASKKLLERYNKCIAARGDYFEGDLSFMYVLSIKVPIRKSLETYLMILVYIYIYIYSETIEEMKEAVTKVIDSLTQEDLHGASKKLLERYKKCIAARGDYFEGDLSFMYVLSIKVPIRKSLETYLMILVIYIYIYIYIVRERESV